eukprot:1160195-Pelagomonas_calceolata.AAC.4
MDWVGVQFVPEWRICCAKEIMLLLFPSLDGLITSTSWSKRSGGGGRWHGLEQDQAWEVAWWCDLEWLRLGKNRIEKEHCTRRALEKTSFNSGHQDQAQGTAKNPPDPH